MQTHTRRSVPPLRRLGVVAALVGAALAPTPTPAATASASVDTTRPAHAAHVSSARPAFDDGHGLHVVSVKATSRRERRLVVATGQLAQRVRVTILLPKGYGRSYRVRNHRTADQDWSQLEDANRARFTLVAANPATVRTPAAYHPGRTYLLTYRGGTGPHRVQAGRQGRLKARIVPDASGTVAVSIARR